MFREMRRKDKGVSKDIAYELLKRTQEGYLSTISVDTGHPAIVCVNHYYDGESIYFHCAKDGHKIDNIKANNKVSFMVVDDIYVYQMKYSTKYTSAVVYGRASFVEDKELKKKILFDLSAKYVGKFISRFASEIAGSLNITKVVKIEIEHISAKKAER